MNLNPEPQLWLILIQIYLFLAVSLSYSHSPPLLVHLNEGLVHVFDNLRGAVGLELEVVVDLGGALNVVGLQVHQQAALHLVNEALGRTGGHQTVLNIITDYIYWALLNALQKKTIKLFLATIVTIRQKL